MFLVLTTKRVQTEIANRWGVIETLSNIYDGYFFAKIVNEL